MSPPAFLTLYGTFSGDNQIESGVLVLFFRLRHFLFTLPDPYVTNQQMPGRFAGRTPTAVNAPAAAVVTSTVAWPNPPAPQLDFALLLPGGPQSQAVLANPAEPATAVPAALTVWLVMRFDPTFSVADGNHGLQFVEHVAWIRPFNIEYFVGVDGLSVTLVVLTALIALVAVGASWSIPLERSIRG